MLLLSCQSGWKGRREIVVDVPRDERSRCPLIGSVMGFDVWFLYFFFVYFSPFCLFITHFVVIGWLVAAVVGPPLLFSYLERLIIVITLCGMLTIRRMSTLAGFLKSRRDRKKEKDKDKNKVSKKKRDSDASSIKSDGEPNLTGSITGVAVSGGGGNVSSSNITLGGVGSSGSGQDSGSFGREKERREDKDESPLYSTGDTASDSAVKVDDEGYTIRPRDETWNAEKTSGFYSSSDADSGNWIFFLNFFFFFMWNN